MRNPRKYLRAAAVALALLSLCLTVTGCDDLVNLTYEDGKFTGKSGTYLPAIGTYEPTSVGDPFARYKSAGLTLYEIPGADPAEWLTEAYAGGATTVFYSENIELPTFRSFGAKTIYVCQSDVRTVSVHEITDEKAIAALIGLYESAPAAEWPLVGATVSYELKFASPAWPQIYMNLQYGEFPEGTFVYERATRRCVEIGSLLDPFIHIEYAATQS